MFTFLILVGVTIVSVILIVTAIVGVCSILLAGHEV